MSMHKKADILLKTCKKSLKNVVVDKQLGLQTTLRVMVCTIFEHFLVLPCVTSNNKMNHIVSTSCVICNKVAFKRARQISVR